MGPEPSEVGGEGKDRSWQAEGIVQLGGRPRDIYGSLCTVAFPPLMFFLLHMVQEITLRLQSPPREFPVSSIML